MKAKWYFNKVLANTDTAVVDSLQDVNGSFGLPYPAQGSGVSELYWCNKSDCSDARLAGFVDGDYHKYLAVAQQYKAQSRTYRHTFLAAFFTNIWRNPAYRHKYLAEPYLFLPIGAIIISSS